MTFHPAWFFPGGVFICLKAVGNQIDPNRQKCKTLRNPFKGVAKGLVFDIAYDSINDMVDDCRATG